jgi:hypothetical protein
VKFLSSLLIEEVQKTQDPLTNWVLVNESDVGSGRDLKETVSDQRRSVVAPVERQDFHIDDFKK